MNENQYKNDVENWFDPLNMHNYHIEKLPQWQKPDFE